MEKVKKPTNPEKMLMNSNMLNSVFYFYLLEIIL
jgi:hypothetical protein